MSSRAGRVVALGGSTVFVFIAVVLVLLRLIPGPHKETDYLVAGTLATFASLGVLFVVLIAGIAKNRTLLHKRGKSPNTADSVNSGNNEEEVI